MTARRPHRAAHTALLTSLTLLLATAAPLHAQRCLGFPGFANQPLRLDGRLETGNHRTDLSADLAFGQAAGVFGGVGLGVADFDGTNRSALLVNGEIGTQVPLGTPTRTSAGAQLCPVATLQYRNGPNSDAVDQNGIDLRGGVSLGTSLPMAQSVRFAPFGTVSFAYLRSTVDNGRASATADDVGGVIDLGAGFIFTDRFTVRPKVSIPVGFDESDARFGIAVGYSFGGGR
jgi:hypothetical protein